MDDVVTLTGLLAGVRAYLKLIDNEGERIADAAAFEKFFKHTNVLSPEEDYDQYLVRTTIDGKPINRNVHTQSFIDNQYGFTPDTEFEPVHLDDNKPIEIIANDLPETTEEKTKGQTNKT